MQIFYFKGKMAIYLTFSFFLFTILYKLENNDSNMRFERSLLHFYATVIILRYKYTAAASI